MPALARRPLPGLATTGIGSLPHTQLELALQQAFLLDIPYLPQLPLRDPTEFMVPQALDGLPGLRSDRDGNAVLDVEEWRRGWLDARLEKATEEGEGLADFEPRPASCAAWGPFVWEVEQRRSAFAKAHLAGPTTLRWALRAPDWRPLWELPDLRLVLARSLAMARRLRDAGATPLIFLDEPGLVAFDRNSGRHLMALQELRVVLLALQREGAYIGVHCCGNTDWAALLELPWDLVSLDARLSLAKLLGSKAAFARFVAGGGALSLGMVPTNLAPANGDGRSEDLDAVVEALVRGVARQLEAAHPGLLGRCLLTPACGLALRSVPDAEDVLERLRGTQRSIRSHLGRVRVSSYTDGW